ncbi:MAG: sodium:proton exchanger [Solirubrobacteraceae bacterium]
MTTLRRFLLGGILALSLLAGGLHYAGVNEIVAFVVAGFALAGLAWVISFTTEEVGEHFGPAVTGILQSTLGNLPEFFVVIFALSAGEVVVAQFSIIGSIFANALLVLGFVIVVGAAKSEDGIMRFNPRLPNDTATLLLLSAFIIGLVGVSANTHDRASDDIVTISAIAAVLVLIVYGVWVWGYLRSTRDEVGGGPREGGMPLKASIALLAIAGLGSAFVSEWFVDALRPTIDAIGVSAQFAGLVVVAIAGNAVEHAVGVVLAYKGQADLAISVVKNSVAQVAAFLAPALVLVSLLFPDPLTFDLAPVYVAAFLLTVIAIWQVTGDGEAWAFEGAALIATYLILAVFTLYE